MVCTLDVRMKADEKKLFSLPKVEKFLILGMYVDQERGEK